jgi:peptide/nickel transport system permease protein
MARSAGATPSVGGWRPAGRRGTWARSVELRWGAGLVAGLLLVAAAAPLLAPYDPDEQLDATAGKGRPPGTVLQAVALADGRWRLAERVERTAAGLRLVRLGQVEELPASAVANLTPGGVGDRRIFVLGSDKFGRDLLSRMIYGTRVSLAVGSLALALALLLGVGIGAAAALGGAWLDMLLMRLLDALLAFPPLFLMIALAAFLRPGNAALVAILAALSWMSVGRLTRAELLSLRQREFVLAARAMGQTPLAILRRHLLPNAMTPVLVQGALLIGNLIVFEASLSFLGLGIQPPAASWGNLLAEGQETLLDAWWVAVFPGAALALTVVAFNLLAEGLRDALDPHGRGARDLHGLDALDPHGGLAPGSP